MTNEVKWYLRRVYGAKAQGYWQLSVGISILVVFVAIPVSYSFARSSKVKSRALNDNNLGYDDAIQRMVYEERLMLRKMKKNKTIE